MSSIVTFYPPCPRNVPDDLTDPSPDYRRQVKMVLASLIAFVGIYLGVLIVSGCGVALAILLLAAAPHFLTFLLLPAAGMLFLFFIKGLFKRQKQDRSHLIEVTEEEHPRLFVFIRELVEDTGAPFPKAVYVSPEVNAAVFYDSSFLNLLIPVQKNLLIGLGLVNVLRLDEFKAVLAHEFGHFSQSSMALGSYVYIAKKVIGDMVYGRDFWDDWLAKARSVDIRISIFAWVIYGIVWVLRKPMELAFKLIAHTDAALSREMEFHADLVAVSVCGSDAMVHSLSRLDFANDCLGQAAEDLAHAKDHGLYSRDLFHHQSEAAKYLRAIRRMPNLGVVPVLPADAKVCINVFNPKDNSVPCMYATHPGNYDREQNAKQLYIRSPQDERSPWILFNEPDKLREKMTRKFYRLAHKLDKRAPLREPAEVQAFIDAEHAETTYDAKYHGLYDGRLIDPGDLEVLKQEVETTRMTPDDLQIAHAQLFTPRLAEQLKTHFKRQEDFALLARVHSGEVMPEEGKFEFRERRYKVDQTQKLLEKVDRELEADHKALAVVDRQVFLVHYRMAALVGEAERSELLTRYRFQLGVQQIGKQIAEGRRLVEQIIVVLSQGGEFSNDDIAEAVLQLRQAREALVKGLAQANALTLPSLRNLALGMRLGEYLFCDPILKDMRPGQREIQGKWIGKLLEQMGEVQDRLRRIHFKSLGGLLAFQEQLVSQWQGRAAPTPFADLDEEEKAVGA